MTVSDFRTRILNGEATSPAEWEQHLREVHERLPGMTSTLFSRHTTSRGQTSYQVLADTAVVAARVLDRPVDVLDLACGDGYLIEICLRQLGGGIKTITGIDMSERELDVARQRLAGQENARLCSGLAQALPLAAASVDVALCHAAFMLMVPVEPVVQELARVLRPGGIFSAVVGSTSASAHASGGEELAKQRALWEQIGVALRQFWQEEYPQLQTDGRVGDRQAMTTEGWKELFRPETGFAGDVEVEELEILITDEAEGIWDFFKETYLVDMLDATMQEKLRSHLMAVLVADERTAGTLAMAFPLQVFSVRRQ